MNENLPPSLNDWLPLTLNSKGDDGCAIRHFFGKSIDEGVKLFEENALRYQEDLLYMPLLPFGYYIKAFEKYLNNKSSEGDSDAASCYLDLVDFKLKEQPCHIRPY